MSERIENSFKDMIAALQIARLYPEWHPEFKKAVEKAHASLLLALEEKAELVIGIVGDELAFEKEIYFEFSKMVLPTINYLKDRGIERIEFFRGLSIEELSKFISLLVVPKEQLKLGVQEALDAQGVKGIFVGRIKGQKLESGGRIKGAVDYLSIYEDSLNKASASLDSVINGEQFDALSLRLTVGNMMDNLLGKHREFLNFATMKRFDSRTFSHMLNVSILSMFFSSKLGFSRQDILDMGTAALFHDIGKMYISRKIIQKPASLTDEEFAQIKSHVTIGAEILLKYVDSIGSLPVVVCFEHHIKFSQKGYPRLSFDEKPHLASSIVSICDVYDALSQRRGYKIDYPPETIYGIMNREKGDSFEPELLERYFKVVGVWPVGTIVSLSDGSVAVVRSENEDDINSPNVEVIWPAERKESIDLRLTKGKIRIGRSLSPLTEGKQYLPMINAGLTSSDNML